MMTGHGRAVLAPLVLTRAPKLGSEAIREHSRKQGIGVPALPESGEQPGIDRISTGDLAKMEGNVESLAQRAVPQIKCEGGLLLPAGRDHIPSDTLSLERSLD